MKATKLFTSFFESEKASGIILLLCTFLSIVITNSAFEETYSHFWHLKIGSFSIEHIINDGLMTIFFLMIGLELEREVYIGELSNIRSAMLPIMGALGGMAVPALIYFFYNQNTPFQDGIGIPMATDIAFAIGILSLLGNKVPLSLKIFLTALAVIDDLGAILVIAFFYTKELNLTYLAIAMGIFGIMLVMNRLKVYKLIPYLILGVIMWYCLLHSGVHATITGVLVAFAIPFQQGEEHSISYQLEHWLHKPVSFIILPIFALANTAIVLNFDASQELLPTYALGIILGLVVGKPLGITLFSFLSVKFKWATMTDGLTWKSIFGVGLLGGIGFTMSIFVTLLAFTDTVIINNAKLYIIVASLISGILGLVFLKYYFNSVKTQA
ncbi:Na+/H+ antiporter NhaA [Flavobacterium luminosum]|uniref:Na(+)/H(+) antiporter NhaA n=1 Tax=Flavobacterium luminosum TaxID=2949086 RepID=A0ABT0TNJ0_9FLAO|nr:Na+/H+ antiporter NhaA [Flavobacterium sp. HXWNR70]MCL9809045.1 Na+/H+ antiporter NhaA [Flavobacterium sp. HXWNR70]